MGTTRIWAAVVVVLLGCHEEGGGCHWPWANGDGDGDEGTAIYGEPCEGTDDCEDGLVCGGDATCHQPGEPGTFGQGDPCASSEYCAYGLVCAATGVCANPGDPGTAGLGEECGDTTDCELGLLCEQDACYGLPLPLWLGEVCEPAEDTEPFRVYFEVPAGNPVHDFYTLPFPNDIRVRDDGTLDLTGHPTPGALIPALGDVVGTVFELLEEDFAGFGNNEAVFFRFSHHIDYDDLTRGHPHEGGTWGIVDLTAGSTYGTQMAGGYATSSGADPYICANWFGIAPVVGRPFLPGHTYAAYIGAGISRDDDGAAMTQDPDFAALLGATAPADTRLSHGYDVYAPLRAWIAAVDGLENEDFGAAAVFTVGDPEAPMLVLREAVQAAPTPIESGLHLCTAVGGPYAGDEDRGCSAVDALFDEVQGLVGLPQFQTGTPPYKNADDGGTIDLANGTPAVVRTEQVNFTLTVPTGATMPLDGWPLVIYGHGTGGNYTSAVREGLAAELSDVVLDDASHQRFATLTIDAPLHGPRRHEENWDDAWLAIDPGAYDADVLYFNPINPRAARDNALQAAADLQALLRWAQLVAWSASGSPTGEAVSFDDDEIFYLGHSQGSTAGVGFVAYEPDIRAAVFSGAGGLLIESLVNKTLPYDMAGAISLGLADATLLDPAQGRYHPVLNLVQGAAERSDGINHAPHLLYTPIGATPRHVFQVFGVGDHYTPDETQEALLKAMRISQVPNGFSPIGGVATTSLPATGNLTGTTGVAVLYGPPGSADAHFVLFDRADAMRQMTHFFGTAVRDGTPTVETLTPP